MHIRAIRLAGLVAAVALVAAGCVGTVVRASGILVVQAHESAAFDRITVGHAFEVDIVEGDEPAVTVEADDNVMDHVTVRVADGTLHIGVRPGVHLRRATLRATVTAPELAGVTAAGAARVRARHPLTGERVHVQASGASDVDADVDATRLEVTASGASTVRLAGSAEAADLQASGASDLELQELHVADAEVRFSGASSGYVQVDDTLDAELSGASSLTYRGEARVTRESLSGASRLTRD